MKRLFCLATALVTLSFATGAVAVVTTNAPFTAGNLVVYRMGTGVAGSLTNRGSAVFLDEYMPLTNASGVATNVVLVNVVPIRTNYFGANSPVVADGTSALEGLITKSVNDRFIVFTGYGATPGQFTNFSLLASFGTEAPRVVGLVDGSGNVNTLTSLTNSVMDGESPRSAASTDGTNLWFTGNILGINYTTRGSNDELQISASPGNTRQSNIFSNQLYFSTGGSNPRLANFTNACCFLPTGTNALFAGLPGVPTDTNQPIAFVLLKLTAGAQPFDTLYFTDDGTLQGNAVQKFSLVGTNWIRNGSIGAFHPVGLVASVDNIGGTTNVHLYITGGGTTLSGGDNMYLPTDSSGYNGTPSVDGNDSVTSFGVINKSLRGIVFSPVGTEPGQLGQISVGPILDYVPRGLTGGPFNPATNLYSVANLGTDTVTWGASVIADGNWLTLSPSSGSLGSNASTTVIATVNGAANSLTGGSNYAATITFTNATSHLGDTIRLATLRVFALNVTTVTNIACGATNTAANFDSVGPEGGPFCPPTYVYKISNSASVASSWSISNGASWFDISATSGTLSAGASTNITLTINNAANDLTRGYRETTLFFNDTTPGHDPGNNTRRVSLTVDIGFYDDFSTYGAGNLVGQQLWVQQGAPVTLPIQVTNSSVRMPGPGGASDNQDARKETGLTNRVSVFYGAVSVVSTAGPNGVLPSFVMALQSSANGAGFANYRFGARQDGVGGFQFAVNLAGFTTWAFDAGGHPFGSTNIVIIQTDPTGSNAWLYANPASPLFTNTSPNATSTGNSGTQVGSVVLSQFENAGAIPGGMNLKRISCSRNPAQVYDELKAGAYASFSASPTNGGAPLIVNFTDKSSGTPLTWAWDFGDAGSSTATNPSHTYTTAGTNTVRLIVTGPTGSSTNTQVALIIVTNGVSGDPYTTWATTYGLSGGNALGTADPDGDGMSNTNEFLAGFNPTNSAARLRIISVATTDSTNITVTYLGASGDSSGSPGPKTNVLESTLGTPAPNYGTNSFVSTGQTNVLTGGSGLGQTATFVHTNGVTNPARYYRVRVLVP